MSKVSCNPLGPYNLVEQSKYFGGWPTLADDTKKIVIAFPVEGWRGSAAVVVEQSEDNCVQTIVHGSAGDDQEQARQQALETLSLDIDATDWPAVGTHDKHIAELQAKYQFLRPVLFSSPYEAAVHFIIGHRISMKQGGAIRAKLAEAHGEKIIIDGQAFPAFPTPQKLLKVSEFPGLNSTKIERLHGIAQAALDGKLDRAALRGLGSAAAREELLKLTGIGPFFAEGILNRGAGVIDELTDDDLTKYAVQMAYDLPGLPDQTEVLQIAEAWKPYRMWAEVLLHVWLRREVGMPPKRFR